MIVESFLEQYVEGYLFSDLEQMATLQPLPNGMGAAGFPIVGTSIAGMGLLGGIVSKSYDGKNNYPEMAAYWDGYLAPAISKYDEVDKEIIQQLVRNGIAHTSLTKHGISITKNKQNHLEHLFDSFNIDALQLFEDFRYSYDEKFKPVVIEGGILNELATKNIQLFYDFAEAQANKILQRTTMSSGIVPSATPLSAVPSGTTMSQNTTTMVERVFSSSRSASQANASTSRQMHSKIDGLPKIETDL